MFNVTRGRECGHPEGCCRLATHAPPTRAVVAATATAAAGKTEVAVVTATIATSVVSSRGAPATTASGGNNGVKREADSAADTSPAASGVVSIGLSKRVPLEGVVMKGGAVQKAPGVAGKEGDQTGSNVCNDGGSDDDTSGGGGSCGQRGSGAADKTQTDGLSFSSLASGDRSARETSSAAALEERRSASNSTASAAAPDAGAGAGAGVSGDVTTGKMNDAAGASGAARAAAAGDGVKSGRTIDRNDGGVAPNAAVSNGAAASGGAAVSAAAGGGDKGKPGGWVGESLAGQPQPTRCSEHAGPGWVKVGAVGGNNDDDDDDDGGSGGASDTSVTHVRNICCFLGGHLRGGFVFSMIGTGCSCRLVCFCFGSALASRQP